MKKLNEREKLIKKSYIDCLNGNKKACGLCADGKWVPVNKNRVRDTYKIMLLLDDGTIYKNYPEHIEKAFFTEEEIENL